MQRAAHPFGEILADREAEPDAFVRAVERAGELHERLEHVRQTVGRNAHTCVAHGEPRNLVVGRALDGNAAALGGELHGVRQQVQQDLLQLLAVCAHGEGRLGERAGVVERLRVELRPDHRLDVRERLAHRHVADVELHA